MRLGIDFGTTHTVLAAVDRGNYPIVSFEHADFVPSLAAAGEDGTLRFGAQAAAVAHDPAWTVLRSFKRLLNDAGPESEVAVCPRTPRARSASSRWTPSAGPASTWSPCSTSPARLVSSTRTASARR